MTPGQADAVEDASYGVGQLAAMVHLVALRVGEMDRGTKESEALHGCARLATLIAIKLDAISG